MNDERAEFLHELQALLQKYNVNISFNVGTGSDTHGIHGEHVTIQKMIHGTFRAKEWLRLDMWNLDASEIAKATK